MQTFLSEIKQYATVLLGDPHVVEKLCPVFATNLVHRFQFNDDTLIKEIGVIDFFQRLTLIICDKRFLSFCFHIPQHKFFFQCFLI